MALHFKQLQGAHALLAIQFVRGMLGQKCRHLFGGAIQDDVDEVVASRPGVFQRLGAAPLECRRQRVAQPIERLPQRLAPRLIPLGMAAGVAAAIRSPAFESVRTTPGGVLENFDPVIRRVHLQELAVVRELGELARVDAPQSEGERHLAVMVMMTVAFTVRCDMGKLRADAIVGESAQQPVRESFAVVEQALECHALRDGSVVEEQRNRLFRRQAQLVRAAWVDAVAGNVFPVAATVSAHAFRLTRRQNREANPLRGQCLQRWNVHGCLRQPHPFRLAAESSYEVAYAPYDLRFLVAWVGQRHDHVVVRLCDGRAVAAEVFLALVVSLANTCEKLRDFLLHPEQERRAEIEADLRVIVHELDDAMLVIEQTRLCIGRVAFRRHAFVPIVVGIGGILELDSLERRIFARRLVKVAVHADVFHGVGPRCGTSAANERGSRVTLRP